MTDTTGVQPNTTSLTRATPPGLLPKLAVDVGLPWLTVQLLERAWDVPLVPALAAAAIFPAVSILASWWRHRRPEFIGLAVLVTIITGMTIALVTNDARFAVLKAAPAFGLFGLACFYSLHWRRPLMFFIGREFNTGGDLEKAAAWDARLESAGFRHAMWHLTVVWGITCIAQSMLGITGALILPPAVALVVEPVLGIGTVTGLLLWTARYARSRSARTGGAK